MAVTVTIGGTDRTSLILYKTLQIQNVITRQVDTCNFEMHVHPGQSVTPTIGQEVIINRDATRIFGGIIVRIEKDTEGYLVKGYKVSCTDYTRLLDAKLIAKVYEGQTVNAIISDINTLYLTGFTIANVDCLVTISRIQFNYHKVSEALQILADLTQFQWYVDYNKDIHFFAKGDELAPVTVLDTNNSYIRDTLNIKNDNTQIKNVVYVRGGDYLGDSFTATYKGDGSQNVFPLTYRYTATGFIVKKNTVTQTVGVEPTNTPASFDVLWNNESRLIRFNVTPSNGDTIEVIGQPFLPVIVKVRDTASITAMAAQEGGTGEHEFIVIDRTIGSKEEARARAIAELNAYAETIDEGGFESWVDGWKAGQQVTITSSNMSIDDTFIISRVTTRMLTPSTFRYQINLVSTRTLGIIEFLQGLILRDKIIIRPDDNEILDNVEAVEDTMTLSESTNAHSGDNVIMDTMTLSENTAGALDNGTIFVLAPFDTPTATKRVFILNGSPLG